MAQTVAQMNLGEVLAIAQENIIQDWVAQVQSDQTIESAHHLTYTAVLNSLPNLLNILEHLLSQPSSEDITDLLEEGLVHGAVRAKQGYDAEEIVREYSVLRNIIFETLEAEMLRSEPLLMLRAIRLIDGALDRVIAYSLKRYTEERIRAVNLLYDELLASNQELDRLVRHARTNMAHLAHELKSPLSSIIGYSDLFLRQQAKTGEVHSHYIAQVLTSGRRLLVMINEALEMSAYATGKVRLTFEQVQVCEVVEEVATVLEILAQQKGLTMTTDCALGQQTVLTDKGRLRQIVTNLISNAIRYTESGSIHIGVRVVRMHNSPDEPLPERIEIAVIDTGLGIDAAEQRQVFEPYYQGKAGQQLACSTGLGLAITHQMVKLLQGNIHLESEPGRGSTFTIALPLQYQQEEAAIEETLPNHELQNIES